MKEKDRLRQVLRERLRSMTREEKDRQSALICRHILEHGLWQRARSVLIYVPLASEPGIRPLMSAAIQARKQSYLPRRVQTADDFEAAAAEEADFDSAPGPLGVREPPPSRIALMANQLDLIMVPGLGFDYQGRRLGRGRGHYDRLLTGASGIRCGVAFAEQIIDGIPLEPHDARMNCIVTPEGWFDVLASRTVLE